MTRWNWEERSASVPIVKLENKKDISPELLDQIVAILWGYAEF